MFPQADAVEKPVSWGGYEAKRDVPQVSGLDHPLSETFGC